MAVPDKGLRDVFSLLAIVSTPDHNPGGRICIRFVL
jgi:hypothetical protein